MDQRKDARDFLISRRARLTPTDAGLPDYGGRRRVPGLRREEVALLAGVSVDYYARLERGDLGGVSEQVLAAIARALKLDPAEREYLFHLASGGETLPLAGEVSAQRPGAVRDGVGDLLGSISGAPACVRTPLLDIVAANPVCVALFDGALDTLPINWARFVFSDPRALRLFGDWAAVADQTVAELGRRRSRRDKGLAALTEDLTARSTEFARRWNREDAAPTGTGRTMFHHSEHGELDLATETLRFTGEPLTLVVWTAAPDSPAAGTLARLAYR